ncbi:hypothetical protein CRYUN_Cryun24cG0116000 [Craigia yunnanensis]
MASKRAKMHLKAIFLELKNAKCKMQNANRGYLSSMNGRSGYHVNYDHVWCGNKATINKTEVYGSSSKNPLVFVSWDGVHYSEAANQFVADHTLNGSLADPPIPITQACHKQ